MCITLPAKVISQNLNWLTVSFLNGDTRRVKLGFGEKIKTGDFILANADLAVAKIDQQEAEEIHNYFLKNN